MKSRVLVVLVVGLLAGCSSGNSGRSNGPSTFTKAGGHGNCGGRQLLVGDQVDVTLKIRNRSGHRWAATWLWFQGDSDFRIESVTMNGRPADDTYRSAAQWAAGPLSTRKAGASAFG